MVLDAVREMPDAENLIMATLQPKARDRPTIDAALAHPFWWKPAHRIAFLTDLSDRVENEDREVWPCNAILGCMRMYIHRGLH